jgi:RING finger protein 121
MVPSPTPPAGNASEAVETVEIVALEDAQGEVIGLVVLENETLPSVEAVHEALGAKGPQAGHHVTIHSRHTGAAGNRHQDDEAVTIFLFLVTFMLGAQVLLFLWKKKHEKSYKAVTLVGLWLFPICVAVNLHFYKMVLVWSFFTCGTFYLMCVSFRGNAGAGVQIDTPRKVYRWFLFVYRLCYTCAVSGYAAIMLDFFGFSDIFMDRSHHMSQFGTYLLFYGLYFGVRRPTPSPPGYGRRLGARLTTRDPHR